MKERNMFLGPHLFESHNVWMSQRPMVHNLSRHIFIYLQEKSHVYSDVYHKEDAWTQDLIGTWAANWNQFQRDDKWVVYYVKSIRSLMHGHGSSNNLLASMPITNDHILLTVAIDRPRWTCTTFLPQWQTDSSCSKAQACMNGYGKPNMIILKNRDRKPQGDHE